VRSSLLRICLIAFVLFGSTGLTKAIVLYSMDLYNNSGYAVDLIDTRTRSAWTTIANRSRKKFVYWEGAVIRVSNRNLRFARVDPPNEYIATGLFSVSFKAQLNPDLRIYLLPVGTHVPARQIPPQPKGFPLTPIR